MVAGNKLNFPFVAISDADNLGVVTADLWVCYYNVTEF